MTTEQNVPTPSGRRPLVLTVRPGVAPLLAERGLDCEILEWKRGEEPPADVQADICFGGNNADDGLAAWVRPGAWVHLTGTGIDNVPRRLFDGRLVTNSPGSNATEVAEFAFATMLSFAKQLDSVWSAPPDARWSDYRLDVLDGRTVGIVGFGHIGKALAARAGAFGMQVLVHTRTRYEGEAVEFVTKETLAERSDHVVLAATASPETRHYIDEAFLKRVRSGVHLVNISRGSLVDQDALRVALDSDRVARASLDVVEPEPLPADHWLRDHPRVRLSPHVAASSIRGADVAVDRFVANFHRYILGRPLENVVSSVSAAGPGA